MKLSNFEKDQQKDKVEITKQQQEEIQKVFDYRIIPHENHILFEVDLNKKTINLAEFKPPKTLVEWSEALEMYHKRVYKKIDIHNSQTVSRSEVIKKENCIYISALNKANVIKILKRDFGINII